MNQVSPNFMDMPAEVDENIFILELVTGSVPEGAFWAYVAMKPSLYVEYHKKVEQDVAINIEDYGKVVEKGWGEQPPPEITEKMKAEYDAEEDFSAKIEQMIIEEQQKVKANE